MGLKTAIAEKRNTTSLAARKWRRKVTPARRAWTVTVVGGTAVVVGFGQVFGSPGAFLAAGVFLLVAGLVVMDADGARRR